MLRVVGGVVTSALLIAGLASCSSGSDQDPTVDASKNVAVDPGDLERHESAPGTPISYGIDVPDGAVQLGPLIRQRRLEVEDVIEDGDRADASGDEADEPDPETHDPEEPTPPDFTTSLLRVDGDPSEVMQSILEEIEDALPDSDVDPDKWADYCTVSKGVYTGCELTASGKTEDDEHITVELSVDPGRPKTKVAPAGSLLRPVMALTIELHRPPADQGDENGDEGDGDGDGDKDGDGKAGRDHPKGDEHASAPPAKNSAQNAGHHLGRHPGAHDARADRSDKRDDRKADRPGRDDRNADNAPEDDKTQPGKADAKWPTMKRERPAKPGDSILTPKWELRRNTEVILSTASPRVAMLAIKDGADADAIARRYVRAFADEATTPKIDEVEDRNERSITYTPRNDGTGPAVAVTAVATGRGNYIELLFQPAASSRHADDKDKHKGKGKGRDHPKDKAGHNKAANRTRSSTG